MKFCANYLKPCRGKTNTFVKNLTEFVERIKNLKYLNEEEEEFK